MKYLKQFGIILFIAFVGEILNGIFPIPIPASIYGIIILFLCLWFKLVSVDSIKEVSSFLIEIMPVMFIPAAVGLMDSWEILKNVWVQYMIITILTTFFVMGVSGRVTQSVIRLLKKEIREHE